MISSRSSLDAQPKLQIAVGFPDWKDSRGLDVPYSPSRFAKIFLKKETPLLSPTRRSRVSFQRSKIL